MSSFIRYSLSEVFKVTWGTPKESQIQWLSRVGRLRAGIVRLSWFIANKSINIQKAFEMETFPDDKRAQGKESDIMTVFVTPLG